MMIFIDPFSIVLKESLGFLGGGSLKLIQVLISILIIIQYFAIEDVRLKKLLTNKKLK